MVRGDAFKVLMKTVSSGRYTGTSTDTVRAHIDQMHEQITDIIKDEELSNRLPATMTVLLDAWTSE
jgi:hypothetical protein